MQNFLVKEEIDFEEMCERFIEDTFSKDKNVTYSVGYHDEYMGTPNYSEFIFIQIMFNEYQYLNGLNEEMSESIGIQFKNNWLKPFYIDGKFKSMEVYEVISWSPLQKNDNVYGMEKEMLQNKFYDFMTNC